MDRITLARMPQTNRLQIRGSGAYGIVVRATRDGDEIALKLIFCSREDQLADAQQERVLAGDALIHPNIIRLHDSFVLQPADALALEQDVRSSLADIGDRDIPRYFQDRNRLHAVCVLAYEFINGGELFDWFSDRAEPNVSEDEARLVFRQLVAAVAHMHQAGFAHRDIKLENAMVAPQNELRLIDFGMATQQRFVTGPDPKGSPTYIAPELRPEARAAGALDLFAADVFSLGVTLYIMVVGAMPWQESSRSCPFFRSYQPHVNNGQPGVGAEGAVRRYAAWCERRRGTRIAAGLSVRVTPS